MSARDACGVLTKRQETLLLELASRAAGLHCCESADGSTRGSGTQGHSAEADYETFCDYWRSAQANYRQLEEVERRAQWRYIEEFSALCNRACDELDKILGQLSSLEEQRQEVVRKTTVLHGKCQQMVQDQERLAKDSEALAERLGHFEQVTSVARTLDQGNIASNHSDLSVVLDQLDRAISFLEAHQDFCQAQGYLHQLEHLRNRACISIRSGLQKSLEKSYAQVQQQIQEAEDAVDTQVFYTRFRVASQSYKPLMDLFHGRVEVHEIYAAALEELEALFCHLRLRLMTAPVTSHLHALVTCDMDQMQLASATRQASSYIVDVCHFERQCFADYFAVRPAQESLQSLLASLADIFYQTMRPSVLSCDSIDCLREIADCLQMDVLEPNLRATNNSIVPVLTVVYRLHKDVQEKLIFHAQTYIRNSIVGNQASPEDLNYPKLLLDDTRLTGAPGEEGCDVGVDEGTGYQLDWFPPLRRALFILAKMYRMVEVSIFQSLAQEAVDCCIASLKSVSCSLAQRMQPEGRRGLDSFVRVLDSQLFLVKNLLILREQVASFECDFVVSEKYFDFVNVREALHFRLPDGLLGILKPRLVVAQTDSKRNIETELKNACETLITHLAASITQPLAPIVARMEEFLAAEGNDRAKLKNQPFMQIDELQEVIEKFMAAVHELIPIAAAHLRLYLVCRNGSVERADVVSADVDQGTATILFKPVQMRVVETWGRVEGLFEEQLSPAAGGERPSIALTSVALGDVVSNLFFEILEAPWSQALALARKRRGWFSQESLDNA